MDDSETVYGKPTQLQWTGPRSLSLAGLIGVCSLGFLLVDIATPSVFDDAFPALVCTNIVTAQLTVICIWGTLVRGTFWIRLPWTFLLLFVSWCALAWGITIDKGNGQTNAILGLGLVWFFGFVASFIPLKVAALCFRWQIYQQHEAIDPQKKNYAIRDVMIGTLLVALVMALARPLLQTESVSFQDVVRTSRLDRPVVVMSIAVFGVVSLLIKLPCIWIALAAKTKSIAGYIGIWILYCFALTVVELIVLTILMEGSENGVALGMIVGHQLMGAIMLAVCLALRGLGYRLERSLGADATGDKPPLTGI